MKKREENNRLIAEFMDATYQAVIKFIEWYNNQKP